MTASVAAFPTRHHQPLDLTVLFSAAKEAYQAEPWPSLRVRRKNLKTLKKMLLDNRQTIADAIAADFGQRSEQETLLGELMPAVDGINHHLRHLAHWLASERRQVSLLMWPARARLDYQPLGVVGIMVPWNYPLYLAIGPITAALAAGNRVLVKMSEHTPQTSALLAKLVGQYFAADLLQVVEGDAKVAAAFSRLPFDHLLFTGSTAVGKQVMRAAADNLTPVTLELGGKSPALVAPDMPLAVAAERILFGKVFNAGQTCVAPDYLLVPAGQGQAMADLLLTLFARFYPNWRTQPQYSNIINGHQYARLQGYLDEAKQAGATVLAPGEADDSHRRLPLTIVLAPSHSLALMREEIFGPILPIIEYQQLDEAIAFICERPRPLAFYPFTYRKSTEQKLLKAIHAGGICVNDTLVQVAADDLPFGGIGPSGMGHYHGREGVLTFSKARPVLAKGRLSSTKLVYPPYRQGLLRLLSRWRLR
ncbi:coniferyl aldehyde dehydrogenase [Gallaecimonas sp. GXIMD1310]|uniref:coniferyl aldehyde dehydrogenase n=1 Tax=Gallaecimonas sp. GXIMD1310 TaxID=3131926 RepID=UPI00324F474E